MKPSELKKERMKIIYDLSKVMTHQEISIKLEIPRSTVTDNVSRWQSKLNQIKLNENKLKKV